MSTCLNDIFFILNINMFLEENATRNTIYQVILASKIINSTCKYWLHYLLLTIFFKLTLCFIKIKPKNCKMCKLFQDLYVAIEVMGFIFNSINQEIQFTRVVSYVECQI